MRYAVDLMAKLPQGVKLSAHSFSGYEVLLNGSLIGTVIQRDRTYNIAPKGFTLRWWEAKLQGAPYPLGVDSVRVAKAGTARDQATKFETRTDAINALLLLSSPQVNSNEKELLS